MVDIQTVSIVLASAGVIAGVVYYVLQIRHQTRLRQTDLAMRLFSTWGSKEFRDMVIEVHSLQFKDYDDFVKKYGPWFSKGPAQTAIGTVANYFEAIGFLVYKKIIDIDFIYNVITFTSIKLHWEKVKPVMMGLRELHSDPRIGLWIEYLYNEMEKYDQKLQAKKGQ